MTSIDFRSVSFSYPHGSQALRDITKSISDGSVTLVLGESGSGKSTMLRCANGLVPHSSGGTFTGDVVVAGRSIRSHHPRDLTDVVGFVHQDPEAHFVVDHVEGDIAFALENLGMAPIAMRRRVEEVLDALGIAHLRDRDPATLSGGEKQRCAIAGAIAAAPTALVLDEPTSQLDPQGADDVIAALVRLNHDLGCTIMMAEHRLERVATFADLSIRLDAGAIVASGEPRAILGTYDGAPTVTQLGAVLGWHPLPLNVREAKPFVANPVPRVSPRDEHVPNGRVLLEARDLTVTYNVRRAVASVDIQLCEGSVIAVLGRNGAGKSTLLRSLAGLVRHSGSIERNARVGFVPQNPNDLLHASTVRAELATTVRMLRSDQSLIDIWLERLALTSHSSRHPRDLSGGERQRVAIAAVAVGGPEILLLDEPTRGMDARSRDALVRAVEAHSARGGAVVIATHDVELAAACATSVVVLADGEKIADGSPRDVLTGSMFAPPLLRVLPPALTLRDLADLHSSEKS